MLYKAFHKADINKQKLFITAKNAKISYTFIHNVSAKLQDY